MKIKTVLITAFLLILSSTTGLASVWQVDKDHAEIRFEVTHILTTVSGHFNEFEGDMVFDPNQPENGKISFTVKVSSADTNNGKRDNHLRSKDFFHADKFPEMDFVSDRISKISNGRYLLEGMLTVKDVSKKIKTEFEYLAPKPHPFAKGKMVSGFVTDFTVNRLDYTVGNGKFLKMGVVGRDVHVTIAVEALTGE